MGKRKKEGKSKEGREGGRKEGKEKEGTQEEKEDKNNCKREDGGGKEGENLLGGVPSPLNPGSL